MSLLELFLTFFYIGLFTIGGGIVSLTLIQQTIVAKGLVSSEQFYNMVAISEATPGPFGINVATYVGFNLYGIPGGIIVSIAEVLPSIICIIIIAKFLTKFSQNPFVKGAFVFLRPITTGLILVPVVNIFALALLNVPSSVSVLTTIQGWKELFNYINIVAYGIFLFAFYKFHMHPILLIIAGALFGIIFL